MRKLSLEQVSDECWRDWHWQVSHAVRDPQALLNVYPNLPPEMYASIAQYCSVYRFRLTPYTLSLIGQDRDGNPLPDDPLWLQVQHVPETTASYSDQSSNWETPEEVHFGIVHQKYPGRCILRVTNACFSFCTYCYLAHRTIDKGAPHVPGYRKVWGSVLAYLRKRSDIYEVLISGGDPLFLPNQDIAALLKDLRAIPSIRFIRLNTRAFTFCPFRIDSELVSILKTFRVDAIEVHFSTHHELTDDADAALRLFETAGHRPLFLSRAPLLRGVNDTPEKLEALLLGLYGRGIVPYYLFHYAPMAPGRVGLGIPVREGADLLRVLRRALPGPAIPRYTLFHVTGKHDIPLDEGGTAAFRYGRNEQGAPIVRFVNRKGEWVTYSDIPEKGS
jgi:lysine 2,3-aminomutase